MSVMSVEEMVSELERIMKEEEPYEYIDDYTCPGEKYRVKSWYLGRFMSLDPCGRYHNILSPNEIKSECEQYWENLEEASERLNVCIESGEGDPTDIFMKKYEEIT